MLDYVLSIRTKDRGLAKWRKEAQRDQDESDAAKPDGFANERSVSSVQEWVVLDTVRRWPAAQELSLIGTAIFLIRCATPTN
jgi:hypothetical protein